MDNNTSKRRSDIIDITGLLKTYLSKWYYFIISVGICGALALCYIAIKKAVYQVNANVLISQEEGGGGSMLTDVTFGLFGGSGYVEDEVFVVSSHSVLSDVVKDMQINKKHLVKDGLLKSFKYKDYPVDVYCNPSIPDTLRVTLQFKVKVNEDGNISVVVKKGWRTQGEVEATSFPVNVSTPYGDFVIDKTEYFVPGEDLATNIYFSSYSAFAEDLSEDLSISIASKKSNVIALGLKHTDIDFAKDLLNNIIAKYNTRGVDEANLKSQKTIDFIDSRLSLLVNDLDASESNIEKFKKERGIVDVGSEASYLMGRTNTLENKLINAETEFEILSMTRSFVSNPENNKSLIPYSSGAGSASSIIASYNSLIMERMKLANNAKTNNKVLQALDEQISALRGNIIETLNKSYETTLYRLNELRAETRESQSKLNVIPTQEREFRNIMRQQSIKENLYIFLLQRREESAMMLANSVPKGIIVDAAYSLNEPVGMSKIMILALSILFGLCIPPIYFYIKKMLRTKFSTKEEVEQKTNIPILGEMCTSSREETLIVKSGGSSSAAELFRLIRSNLQFILGGMNDKVVLLTSTISGEGKSFISINLAASLAMLGKKVVLVGMDIRCPKLAEYLNLKVNKGLTEYLSAQSITLDDIVIKDAMQENMDIIVAGPIPPNPSELLASSKVDHLFTALREKYDYIIVDSAPVGMVSDTFSLARISDATVYVCRANYTNLKDLEFINSLYADNRLKRMSLVVNGTESKKGYGYGYGETFKGK